LSIEKNLLTDNTSYANSGTGLLLIHDYGNIMVPAGGALVYFTAKIGIWANADPNSSTSGDFILKIGPGTAAGKHLSCSGTPPVFVNVFDTMGAVVWLAAGTYDISVYGQATDTVTNLVIQGLSVGITSFNDLVASAFQSYTGAGNSIPLTVSARNTPVGALSQAVYAVTIGSSIAWGSGLTVQVDGVTQTAPDEDAGVGGTGTYVYKLFIPLSVGTSHTITIGLTSGSAYVSVVACPWILTLAARNGHMPVSLDFSQLSTLYVNLGSLFADKPKNCYLGIAKAVSFGKSDYYASGTVTTGILSFSYTFSSLNVVIATLTMDSSTVLGGCIENVGVDIQ